MSQLYAPAKGLREKRRAAGWSTTRLRPADASPPGGAAGRGWCPHRSPRGNHMLDIGLLRNVDEPVERSAFVGDRIRPHQEQPAGSGRAGSKVAGRRKSRYVTGRPGKVRWRAPTLGSSRTHRRTRGRQRPYDRPANVAVSAGDEDRAGHLVLRPSQPPTVDPEAVARRMRSCPPGSRVRAARRLEIRINVIATDATLVRTATSKVRTRSSQSLTGLGADGAVFSGCPSRRQGSR